MIFGMASASIRNLKITNQFMKDSIQNLIKYCGYIVIRLYAVALMALFCLGFSGQIKGQSGDNLRCHSSGYASTMVALQVSPAITEMLAKAPSIHDEVESFIARPKPVYAVMTTDAGRTMDALAVDNPVIFNPVSDSLELVKLYNATNGSGWTNNTNWLVPGQAIGTWYGIGVNSGGCVTGIFLSSNQMSGSIPNLYLPNLVDLYLDNNQLSGNVPNFNLLNLQVISLDNNQLSGTIPNFVLPNLRNLYLSSNQLSGSLPNFNLPNLQNLWLSNNQLSGNIPNLNLPNLQVLYLNTNEISGTIPNFTLPNLQVLFIYLNQLSGSIPNFNLPKLQNLSLSDNQLSGNIPNFNLPNLQYLFLFNNQLSGSIPNFNLLSLQILSLPNNQLSGSIPSFNLPSLQILSFSNNQLSGNIPNFNLPNLQILSLSNNQLSGNIPNFNLPNLKNLRLNNNNLSSAPKFTLMPILGISTVSSDSLSLSNNHLTFKDIVPNMPLINGFNGNKVQYAPQDSIYTDTLITGNAGQNLTIDLGIDPSITTNVYQWYKNGQLWTPPAGNSTNSNKLIFNNLSTNNSGTYHVRVRNPNAPALTLYSRMITLNVSSCTTVTITDNSGPGSLRAAIICANSNPGPDTIRFDIAGAGPHEIMLQTGLPVITNSGTIIDGSTQPQGQIVIDGSTMSSGEIIYASDCDKTEVYGLILKNAVGSGIAMVNCDNVTIGAPGKGNIVYGSGQLDAPYPYDFVNFANNYNPDIILFNCTNSKVQSNQVGITENGGLPTRPVAYGITVAGQNNLIGGNRSANEGNTIGNCYHGVSTWDLVGSFPQTNNIRFYGNNIGTGFTGTEDFGNVIGTFTYNEVANVRVGNSTDQQNIYKFNGTGIKIGGNGFGNGQVRINQNIFSCNDVGALIEAAPAHPLAITLANTTQVTGTANAGDLVEIYKFDKSTCPTAGCQGTVYLGQTTADNAGNWAFSGVFPIGDDLTATATSSTGGWTYGFEACKTVQVTNTCNPVSDSLELVKLYNATNGPGWVDKTNWLVPGKAIGTWYGVQVNVGGCVTRIVLNDNQLNGSIPNLNLFNLERLWLDSNQLSGNIPNFNLPNLQQLRLSNNQLSGSIPNFDLPNLQRLFLSNNNLNSNIPNFNLPNLQRLWLGNNLLIGNVPNFILPNLLSKYPQF
jgi:Leucine-rich repeat (LRR) protein